MSTNMQGNANEDSCGYDFLLDQSAGRPQVWIRLRPPPRYDDNVFEIGLDGKSLRLLVEPDEHIARRIENKNPDGKYKGLTFTADGILQSSSQEDTYSIIVNEVVDKAMNGINGAIISLGPEVSGKSFTLFGYLSKFEYRGVIPRALERIFQLVEAKCQEVHYIIRIGIIELRRDRIRDLLTLGPYELQHVGENGPYGMLLQQIGCAEHGLGLLIRALAGQKNIPRESFARYHTVVYIDIQGQTYSEAEPRVMRARLTFAKIASMPKRANAFMPSDKVNPFDGFMEVDGCVYARPANAVTQVRDRPKKCSDGCHKKSGPMAEAIGVRRDLSFLEQMLIGANELRKLAKYYSRLQRIGMTMFMKRPKPAPSQYFRQSKLTHCLQDIVSGSTEVRIILHIRPEKQYLHTSLEAIRFAERAKCVPYDLVQVAHEDDAMKNEITSLLGELQRQDRLAKRPQEMSEACNHLAQQNKVRADLSQAQPGDEYYEGRLKQIEGVIQAQVRATFESFRQLWKTNASESEWDQMLNSLNFSPERGPAAPVEVVQGEVIIPIQSTKSSKKNKGKSTPKLNKKKKDKDAANQPPVTQPNSGNSAQDMHLSGENVAEGFADENIEDSEENESPGYIDTDVEIVKSSPETLSKLKPSVLDTQQVEQNDAQREPVDPNKDHPTKAEVWQAFLKTKRGRSLFKDLSQNDNALRASTNEHNEVLRKVSGLLSRLNQFQSDLDNMQQERQLRGTEYDESSNIIVTPQEKELLRDIKVLLVSRDELIERLKSLRMQLHAQKRVVEVVKNECDVALQKFCLDRYSNAFTADEQHTEANPNLDQPVEVSLANQSQSQNEDEAAKHFNELKKLARLQAKQFLRFHPKRPLWTPY